MIKDSVIKPKTPKSKDWVFCGEEENVLCPGYFMSAWVHPESRIYVTSAVEVVVDEEDIQKGPEYHIAISQNGGRCDSKTSKWVVKEFDMDGADEDNHVPHGITRHFWKPVAEGLIGYECPCKDTEPAISEDKGDFIWRP